MSDVSFLFRKACEEWEKGHLRSAFRKFHQASLLGDADSQNNLGVFFENGIGVTSDFEKAIFWYKKSIDNGSICSLNNVANLYKKLEFFDLAVEWYGVSIRAGDGDSMLELGRMYLTGDGITKDKKLAKELLVKAISSTNITRDSKDHAQKIIRDL